MQITPLVGRLAEQIAKHIGDAGLDRGHRLTERGLADRFRVSRSPVRGALLVLQDRGVVSPAERGGFAIADGWMREPFALATPTPDEDERAYLRIADDRLNGLLPERVTENALLRRYAVTKGRLARVLRRMMNEGWIERLPGHGWGFLPVLTSLRAYEDSYRFRLVIEPAAILEPRFALDRPILERCREQQQGLVDGGIWDVTGPKLFELNSGTHEAIIACSRNRFFIDALERIDRLRRLIEYRQGLDRVSAQARCKEHVALLDLLLAGQREEASAAMRRHLSDLITVKTVVRQRPAAGSPCIGP